MPHPVRVLHVDDSSSDRDLVRHALEKEPGDFVVTEAANYEEFKTQMAAGAYDVVLTDFHMLGFDGLHILDMVQAIEPRVPVVIVTGTGSEEVAVTAMKQGAADYVLKTPRHIQRLPCTIQTVLGQRRQQEARLQAEAALRESQQFIQSTLEAMQAVRDVTLEITHELDLTTLLELIIQRAMALVATATAGVVWLWDEAAQVLAPHAWRGRGEWLRDLRLRLGEGVAGTVAQQRKGLAVQEYANFPAAHPVFLERIKSPMILSEPLLYRDRLVGVISLANEQSERPFGAQERDLLVLFAAQAAIAIENARLYAEVVQRQQVAQRLSDLGRRLAESFDPLEVGQQIVESVRQLCGVLVATVYQLEPSSDTLIILATSGEMEPYRHMLALPSGMGVAGLAVQRRQPVVTPDFRTDSRLTYTSEVRARLDSVPYQAVLAVPLLVKDEIIGALAMGDRAGREFDTATLEVAQTFASQAALALEKARMYTQMQDTRDFLHSILANSADAIMTTDLHGRVTYVSPGAEAMFGYGAPELLGQSIASYYRGGAEELRLIMRRLDRVGQWQNYETAVWGKNGCWIEVNASYSLLRDAHGQVSGSLGVIKDITEQKRLEEALVTISEREQQRLGQDLHDGLGQQLTGLAFLSKAVERKLQARGAPEAAEVTHLVDLINRTITHTRELSHGFYPVELQREGLKSVLQALAAHMRQTFGVDCQVTGHLPGWVSKPQIAIHLYRIAQEAMHNAIRHGRARQVMIRLRRTAKHLRLIIQDNGIGITDEAAQGRGMGLQTMRHRASLIGAILNVERGASGGTCVSCIVPIPPTPRQGGNRHEREGSVGGFANLSPHPYCG